MVKIRKMIRIGLISVEIKSIVVYDEWKILLRKYDKMREFLCLVTLESMPNASKNDPFSVLIAMENSSFYPDRSHMNTVRNMGVQEHLAHGASVILISNTQSICIFMSFSIDIFI